MQAGPISLASPLNLDGLLAYAKATRPLAPSEVSDPPAMSLPLAEVDGVYLSSDAMYTARVWRSGTSLTQRRERPYDPVMKRQPLLNTERLEWLCYGQADAIASLLAGVDALGSYRGLGYGRVAKWHVKASDGRAADCLVGGGKTLRTLPSAWLWPAERRLSLPCRPPYWHAGSHRECEPGGSMASLRAGVVASLP